MCFVPRSPQAPLHVNGRALGLFPCTKCESFCRCAAAFLRQSRASWRAFKGQQYAVPPARSAREKKAARQAPCFASLLRQNRQAELASLKDDLLRCLLFGVDPIESDKETQKFESQSVASGQGKPPRALVVLLRRETRSLHTQKRQIGSQISTK